MKTFQHFVVFSLFMFVGTLLSAPAVLASIVTQTSGYILLQVESHGEAWYVDPLSKNRFYMQDGPAAYEMMRTFGLGMTEVDYAALAAGDPGLTDRLRGRIVLRVENHGEAYYIHPEGSLYYLADGPAAYEIMREHSLGITNADLAKIPEVTEAVTLSEYQAGDLPSDFDIQTLNNQWLGMVNAERVERGSEPLVLAQELVDTTANWSAYMGQTGNFTHDRPYGESLLDWFQGSPYETHDVGENLAFVAVSNSQQGMEDVLTNAMDMFMSQESYNGTHFQNVVDVDWETTGAGFYFTAIDSDTYEVYAAFHFASID